MQRIKGLQQCWPVVMYLLMNGNPEVLFMCLMHLAQAGYDYLSWYLSTRVQLFLCLRMVRGPPACGRGQRWQGPRQESCLDQRVEAHLDGGRRENAMPGWGGECG